MVEEDDVGEPVQVLEACLVLGVDFDMAFDVLGGGGLDGDPLRFREWGVDHADGVITDSLHAFTFGTS
jgi:hypothetical protein